MNSIKPLSPETTKKLFLFIFIFFSFFFRTDNFFGVINISTLWFAYVALLFLLLCQVDFKSMKVKYIKINTSHLFFLIVLIVGFVWNITFYPHYFKYIIIFFSEIIFNIFVFYYFYLLSATNITNMDICINYLIIGALIYPIPAIIFVSFNLDKIRRIGTFDAPVITAVNHLSHSLAIVSYILFILILFNYFSQKKRKLFSNIALIFLFTVTLSSTFLTGSRAGVMGLLFSIIFVIVLYSNKKKIFNVLVALTLSLTAFFFVYFDKIVSLLNRFSQKSILYSAMGRLNLFERIFITHFSFEQIVLGAGWFRYQPLGAVRDFILYPHNIILEFFLTMGIFTALLFLYILSKEWFFLVKYLIKNKANIGKKIIVKYALIIFGALNISIFYSFTSGRLTRIVVIFCILGLAAGFRKWCGRKEILN